MNEKTEPGVAAAVAAQKAVADAQQGTCPNCGYCPHCGRAAAPRVPWSYPPERPYLPPRPMRPYWQKHSPNICQATLQHDPRSYTLH